jgi:hypothetical protein
LKALIFANHLLNIDSLGIDFQGGGGEEKHGFSAESRDCVTREEGYLREDHGRWIAAIDEAVVVNWGPQLQLQDQNREAEAEAEAEDVDFVIVV